MISVSFIIVDPSPASLFHTDSSILNRNRHYRLKTLIYLVSPFPPFSDPPYCFQNHNCDLITWLLKMTQGKGFTNMRYENHYSVIARRRVGKGGNRFWKSIGLGFKTPTESIEGIVFICLLCVELLNRFKGFMMYVI